MGNFMPAARRGDASPVGLCAKAIELLGERKVGPLVMRELRVLKPRRQIEVVRSMNALNCFSVKFALAMSIATPPDQVIDARKRRGVTLTDSQRATMQRASARMVRQLAEVQSRLGADGLDLVLLRGFLDRVLTNARVVRYLAQHYPKELGVFQDVIDAAKA